MGKPNWLLKSRKKGQRGREQPREDKEPWPRQLGNLRPWSHLPIPREVPLWTFWAAVGM